MFLQIQIYFESVALNGVSWLKVANTIDASLVSAG
jgi:hypothetical protein